jgi:hypothetical protein
MNAISAWIIFCLVIVDMASLLSGYLKKATNQSMLKVINSQENV